MGESVIKKLDELFPTGSPIQNVQWQLRTIVDGECLTHLAYNDDTREALWVDPKQEILQICEKISGELKAYRWLAVIDTHTHADHISAASILGSRLNAPYVMHEKSTSRRVNIRISLDTRLLTQAGEIHFVPTPGHTPDGMCVIWGPFLFTGDTVLLNDVGRDDLPGGDPQSHFYSVQALKKVVRPSSILLPGHDHKGGRADLWESQLVTNPSLSQDFEDFVRESAAFVAPAPKQFKEALVENMK